MNSALRVQESRAISLLAISTTRFADGNLITWSCPSQESSTHTKGGGLTVSIKRLESSRIHTGGRPSNAVPCSINESLSQPSYWIREDHPSTRDNHISRSRAENPSPLVKIL